MSAARPMLLAWCFVASAACTPTLSTPDAPRHLDALARGARHTHHGRHRDAAAAYREAADAARRRVDRDEAEYREARAWQRVDEVDRALSLLDTISARRPVSRRTARARYDAAVLRASRGDVERGRRELEAVVREHPDAGVASHALRRLRALSSSPADFDTFLARLYPAIGASELGDDVLFLRAELALEANDATTAIRWLEQLVREHPYPHGARWDDALMRLADLAEQRGDVRAAMRYLEELVSYAEATQTPGSYTVPKMPAAMLRIARLQRDALRDREAADTTFLRLVDTFEFSTLRDDALVERGEMWLDAGERVRGCEALREVVTAFDVGAARRRAVTRLDRDCAREDASAVR